MNFRWLLILLNLFVLIAAAIHNPIDLSVKVAVGLQLLYYSRLLAIKDVSNSTKSNRLALIFLWGTLLTMLAGLTLKFICRNGRNGMCEEWMLPLVDGNCTQGLFKLVFDICGILQVASPLCCLLVICSTERDEDLGGLLRLRRASEFVAMLSRYLSVVLLYGLVYVEQGRMQVVWTVLCCLYSTLGEKRIEIMKLTTTVVAAALFCEFAILDDSFKQIRVVDYFYGNRSYRLDLVYIRELLLVVKVLIVFLIGNKIMYTLNADSVEEAEESIQSSRLSLKRRKTGEEVSSVYKIIAVHAATLYVLLSRTTPGCLVLAIALALSIPRIDSWHRPLLLLGGSLCLIWQPNRLELIAYLLFVMYFKLNISNLQPFPLLWLIAPMRALILFSRVNIVNFLVGLISHRHLVLAAILFRIGSRLWGYNNQIIGLDDTYGIVSPSNAALSDIFLWVLLLSTRLNGESAQSSRLLLWIFGSLQCVLHILRYFHWIAYTLACGIVLAADQSLFTLAEFVLVLGLICSEVFLQDLKNLWLRRLWSIYIAWLFFKIAIEYFYLFSQYIPNWGPFQRIKPYERLIGLEPADTPPSEAFIEEGVMLVVAWLSRYVQIIKLTYRGNLRATDRRTQPLLTSSERRLEAADASAFSRIRMSLIQPDADDITYIYEQFIAPARSSALSARMSCLYHILAKPLLEINFIVILVAHLTSSFKPEYLLYGIVMVVYYLQINIMKGNAHNSFSSALLISSQDASAVEELKASIKATHRNASRMSHLANLSLIVISTGSVLLHYFQLLYYALYYGESQSRYRFTDILPQFIIVLVSIVVRQVTPKQTEADVQNLVIQFEEPNKKIWLELTVVAVRIAETILMSYLVTVLLNRDASALAALMLLVACRFVPVNVFVACSALVSLVGIALMQANLIVLLLLSKLLLYVKFKAAQTLAYNLPVQQATCRNENIYKCGIKFTPTILLLLALPCTLSQLVPANILLFGGIVGCIFSREALKATRHIRTVLIMLIAYATLLYTVKIVLGFFRRQFWIGHLPLFLLLSLLTLCLDTASSPASIARQQEAATYIAHKGSLVGQLTGYLHNEFKLQSLKRFYIQKRSLSDKIATVQRELESSRRQNMDSFGKLLLLQEDEREDKYGRLLNSVLFYPIPMLHQLLGCFHHYLDKAGQNNQHIRQVQTRVLDQFKDNFNYTVRKVLAKIEEERPAENLANSAGEEVALRQPERELPQLQLQAESIQELTSLEKQNNYQQYHLALLKSFMPETDSWIAQAGKFILANFDYVGFGALIGWNFAGGLYTLPASVFVFAWAIPLESKTPARFWKLLLLYVSLILTIKLALPGLSESNIPYFVFGTAKQTILYEYLLIIVLVAEIIVGEFFGTSSEQLQQSFNDSLFRTALNRASFGITNPEEDERFVQYYRQFNNKESGFLYQLFSKLNMKPGRDFYPLICSSQVCICLYIFFLYDMVEYENKKNTTAIKEALSYNQFSKHMVIVLFLQILVMIADRFVTTYNYHDPGEQALQSFLLRYTFDPTLNAHSNNENSFQFKSRYDLPLVIKYIMHLIVLLVVNLFVFMYVPGGDKQCPIDTENEVCQPKFFYLMGFFGLYLVYFFFNAQQIRYGFTRLKGKNTLMMGYHFMHMYLYKAFMAVPFLSEFKKLADWTLTSTGLPLFHWLKFEDIHSRLYVCKCETEMLRRKPFGVETWWVRYLIAPVGFLSILLIIFGPLIMYSTANPFAVMDEVIGAQVQISLELNGIARYDFFENSHVVRIKKLSQGISKEHLYNSREKSLYEIQMNKFPDSNMLLSEPVVSSIVRKMEQRLQGTGKTTFKLRMRVDIIEKEGGKSKIQWASRELEGSSLKEFMAFITGTKVDLEIKGFYSPLPSRMKEISLFIRNHERYWQVYSQGDILQLYYITSSKFKVRFDVVTFYLTYVLLISRLFRFYLTANVENAIFEGSELQRVLYLCSAVISARRLQNFEKEQYFYFELMDLIRSPQKMLRTTGSLKEFRVRC